MNEVKLSMASPPNEEASSSINTFPPEVLEEICHYLSPVELSKLAQTSRLMYEISTSSTLWERAYLTFWRESEEGKRRFVDTINWRERRRFAELKEAAKRAWIQENQIAENSIHYSKRRKKLNRSIEQRLRVPFPLALTCNPSNSAGSSTYTRAEINFYKLFLERIHIDEEVLQKLYDQCQSACNWMNRVEELVNEHGKDAKDVLHALLVCQSRNDHVPSGALTMQDCSQEAAEFPTALQLRLPWTKASKSHRLSLINYGRELLEHIQRREALQGLVSLRSSSLLSSTTSNWQGIYRQDDDDDGGRKLSLSPAEKAKGFENAISWLSMFRGGEGQEIAEELDTIAISCALFLASHKITLEGSTPRQFALGVYQFMHSRGFTGATPAEYKNLDNNFLHFCLDESGRKSLPMSLVVIFCAIASRLGLPALPTNTPARILAIIETTQVSSSQNAMQDRFWVDVYEDGLIMEINDVAAFLARMKCPLQESHIVANKPSDACTRAARNIVMSVQGAQGVPHILGSSLSFDEEDIVMNLSESNWLRSDQNFDKIVKSVTFAFAPRRSHLTSKGAYLNSPFWTSDTTAKKNRYERVSTWSDYDQQASMHAASNALTRIGDEFGSRGNDWCASLIQTYFPLDTLVMRDEYVEESKGSPLFIRNEESRESMTRLFDTLISNDRKGPEPKFRSLPEHKNIYSIGILFTHRVQKYKAAIVGWTDKCNAPEEWIMSMGVDSLPNRGRFQPFYHCLVEDGSSRYVAHCNIIPATSSSNGGLRYLSSPRISSPGILKPSSVMSISDVESVVQQRGIGKLFRCIVEENGYLKLLKNKQGEQAFPDD